MKPLKVTMCVALWALGCSGQTQPPQAHEPVIVFVAASTKDAATEIASAFKDETQIEVRISADDSSKLAMQIVQEAPAQLFLSANEKWADYIKEKGVAHETRLLLGNTLVLVTPKGNPANVHGAEDLSKAAVRRVAIAGPTVPAGIYGRQALKNLKVWDSLEAGKKIISGENVRVTLAYVEQGEVDAGIVYATDGKISDKIDLVYTFPATSHEPIHYPLVLLKTGDSSASARSFFEYIQSDRAREIFARHGFSLPPMK
jgi:molybdate transport system substrate-binding protein